MVIFPTWDKRNFCSASIELIISAVLGLTVCFTILEGSIPNSFKLKVVFVVVVVVVVVAVVVPCCIYWEKSCWANSAWGWLVSILAVANEDVV